MANPLDLKPEEKVEGENPTGSVQGAAGPQATPARQAPEQPPAPPDASGRERRRLGRLAAISDVIIATGVVLTLCYVAKLVLVVLLVSILLSFVLAPLVDLFQRIRLPRPLGSLLAVLILVAAIYGITYVGYSNAVSFAQQLPKYRSEIRRVITHVRQKAETIQKSTEDVLPPRDADKNAVHVQQATPWSEVTQRLGSVTELVFAISFVPFLVYFMLSWQEHVRSATVMLFRMDNRNTAYVTLGLISSMIRSFIVGNVLVGLFLGTASMAAFAFMHLPYFYFLGYISGFLSLVPYLGPVLAIVPPVVAGMGHIHSAQFVAIIVIVFALHLFALNVLYPKFLGSRLQLNPLAVTLALLFWGWLWGAMGLILAIPITAAVKIIFDHVESLRPYGAWLGE